MSHAASSPGAWLSGGPDGGACLAALFLRALLGKLAYLSAILGTVSGARNVGSNAAIAVGGYVALSGLWADPLTGVSMKPARSFGPELIGGDWHARWVHLIGPLAGGLVAVGIAWILQGPPSKRADASAQGDLGSPEETLGGNEH